MSSRRSRLKAVANLPVRRKPNLDGKDDPKPSEGIGTTPAPSDEEKSLPQLPADDEISKESVKTEPVKTLGDREIVEKEQPNKSIPSQSEANVFVKPNSGYDRVRKISTHISDDNRKTIILPSRVRTTSESSTSGRELTSLPVNNQSDDKKAASTSVKRKRPKCNDLTRKLADARREFQRRYEKIKPDRSSLRMIDLIFYNPTTNPMEPKTKMEKKEPCLEEEDELLVEGRVEDPDDVDNPSDRNNFDSVQNDYDEDMTRMPVPQVKIGLNGEIILDEKSLVIETTDAKKGREDLQNSVPIFEDKGNRVSYYCRKSRKTKDWTDSETKRFYKSLNTLGTDFLLMQQLFPNRSRLELKNKFKREEKLNRNLIDKALNNPSEFDMTQLELDLAIEKKAQEDENEKKLQRKTRPKKSESKPRTKSSWLSREMAAVDGGESNDQKATVQEESKKLALRMEKERLKRQNDADMLVEKFLQNRNNANNLVDMKPVINEEMRDENVNSLPEKTEVIKRVIKRREFKSRKRKAEAEPSADSQFSKILKIDVPKIVTPKVTDKLSPNEDIVHRKDVDPIAEVDPLGEVDPIAEVDPTGEVDPLAEVDAVLENNASSEASEQEQISSSSTVTARPAKSTCRKSYKRKGEGEKKRKLKKPKGQKITIIGPDVEENEGVATDSESFNKEEVTTTKTITDQDFFQLLALNVKNLKETTIKVQVTENFSGNKEEPQKKIEVIFDNVPPITLNEIEDQNVRVLADFNTTVCESTETNLRTSEGSKTSDNSSDGTETENHRSSNETSVIVKNPNVFPKQSEIPDAVFAGKKEVAENEKIMLVINENEYGRTNEYHYTMVAEQEVEVPSEDVETEDTYETYNIVEATEEEEYEPDAGPSVVVRKCPETGPKNVYLTGLSEGSFVLMPKQRTSKRLSMFMVSEQTRSDETSGVRVIHPTEFITNISQELDCS